MARGNRFFVVLFATALMAILTSASFAQAGSVQAPQIPTLTGLYSLTASGYAKMELATSSGFKTHGGLAAGFSYGIAKVKGDWLYRGETAAAQVTNRPTFVLVTQMDVSTQSMALVRFDIKKGHREAQYIEVGIWSGASEENKNTIPLIVTRLPNSNTLTITPASDLPAGEYLLIADQGKGYDGYDFAVK